jgi:hypothetical protein
MSGGYAMTATALRTRLTRKAFGRPLYAQFTLRDPCNLEVNRRGTLNIHHATTVVQNCGSTHVREIQRLLEYIHFTGFTQRIPQKVRWLRQAR